MCNTCAIQRIARISASCSASLLVKGHETLVLFVTRVRGTLGKSLESLWDTLVVAVARCLCLRLADRAQVVSHVVLLAHVVASEDVRADAVGLKPLARNARQVCWVALALRATPVDELPALHLDDQVHRENRVHPELDIRHHASVACACQRALKNLDNLLRELLLVLATVVLHEDEVGLDALAHVVVLCILFHLEIHVFGKYSNCTT